MCQEGLLPSEGTVNLIPNQGLRLADNKYYEMIRDCLEGFGGLGSHLTPAIVFHMTNRSRMTTRYCLAGRR
jgi:hypothetical protein